MTMYRRGAVCGLLLGALFSGLTPVAAEEQLTKEDAVALVKTVRADIEKKGLAAVVQDINDKKYNRGDLYPLINRFDGVSVAHGSNKALVGANLITLKDQNGRLVVAEQIEMAKANGSGWVYFMWTNPTSKKAQSKALYVEKIDETELVGAGVYIDP